MFIPRGDDSFIPVYSVSCTELKTLECDILNPDLLTNLEIKFMRKTGNI